MKGRLRIGPILAPHGIQSKNPRGRSKPDPGGPYPLASVRLSFRWRCPFGPPGLDSLFPSPRDPWWPVPQAFGASAAASNLTAGSPCPNFPVSGLSKSVLSGGDGRWFQGRGTAAVVSNNVQRERPRVKRFGGSGKILGRNNMRGLGVKLRKTPPARISASFSPSTTYPIVTG